MCSNCRRARACSGAGAVDMFPLDAFVAPAKCPSSDNSFHFQQRALSLSFSLALAVWSLRTAPCAAQHNRFQRCVQNMRTWSRLKDLLAVVLAYESCTRHEHLNAHLALCTLHVRRASYHVLWLKVKESPWGPRDAGRRAWSCEMVVNQFRFSCTCLRRLHWYWLHHRDGHPAVWSTSLNEEKCTWAISVITWPQLRNCWEKLGVIMWLLISTNRLHRYWSRHENRSGLLIIRTMTLNLQIS